MSAAMDDPRADREAILAEQRERAGVFVTRGWFPFPVEYGGKRPGVGIKWGTATATVPTPKMLDHWFGREPMNIGIAARPSRLVILDADRDGAMEDLCAAYGQQIPRTYRVQTAKGWHWYFEAPDDVEIGNSPGALKAFGFDVRGGRGDGGYVVSAGSLHETGHVYLAEDDDADTVALPWWIVELLLGPTPVEDSGEAAEPPPAPRPFDERRAFTMAEAQAFVKPLIDALKAAGKGEVNEALNSAARAIAHFGPEFWPRSQAERWLMQYQLKPWHDADESGARATIASAYAAQARDEAGGARDRATGRPLGWRAELVEGGDPFGGEEGDLDAESRAAAEAVEFERAVEVEARRQRIREEAERRIRTEDMPPLAVLDAGEFLSSAMPEYLVRGFLYRASTAKVYGPPGGTKSFFLLDVALHLATGRPWQGRDLPRTRVHYVMAEGQAVNTLRTLGWLAHFKAEPEQLDGWFTAIPQGVLLTPEGVAGYLALVIERQPGLIILDTKNRMMVGEENSASDVAVMIRAMDAIREASGACVCLVDHTGLVDQTRGRGSNAVTAAMDSEIRVGLADGIATAEVTRDKAGVIGEKISYQLVEVPSVATPSGVRAPAVCEPVDATVVFDSAAADARRTWANKDWWLPEDVLDLTGPGRAAVPDVARYMRWTTRDHKAAGRTRAEMCRDVLKLGTYRDDTVLRNAWDRLFTARRIQNVSSTSTSRTVACHWIERDGDPTEERECL